jgi:hypothetical protein
MTRKNLILLLFSLLTLNSCNKHEGPELRFCENYIQNYCQGDLVLLSRSPDRPPANPGRPANPHTQFLDRIDRLRVDFPRKRPSGVRTPGDSQRGRRL